jgi:Flp pilus assembly protein TadD
VLNTNVLTAPAGSRGCKTSGFECSAAAAEPAFREAVKLNPDDFDANLYLGAILYKQRHLPEAKLDLGLGQAQTTAPLGQGKN